MTEVLRYMDVTVSNTTARSNRPILREGPESPWIPPKKRPHGVQRAGREHVPDDPARPGAELPLVLVGLDELRQTVIRMVARRAAAILKENEDDSQGLQG